jgi:hypothetical protein
MKLGQQIATSLPPRRQDIDVGKKNMDSLIAFVSNNVIDILFSSTAIDMSYCSNLGIDITPIRFVPIDMLISPKPIGGIDMLVSSSVIAISLCVKGIDIALVGELTGASVISGR